MVVLGSNGMVPLFGIIKELFIFARKPVARISTCSTRGFYEHYRYYVVSEDINSQDLFKQLLTLYDHSVLTMHSSYCQTDTSAYICLKYSIE